MRASRGMGAIAPSKMPDAGKSVERKDLPESVQVFSAGGQPAKRKKPVKRKSTK